MTDTTCNYANAIEFSDVHPFEIVRRVSDRTLDIRAMNAEIASDWKPEWISGGFAGHCTNQRSQRWTIESDPTGNVIRIRLGKKGWRDADGGRYSLASEPVRFHDFNF